MIVYKITFDKIAEGMPPGVVNYAGFNASDGAYLWVIHAMRRQGMPTPDSPGLVVATSIQPPRPSPTRHPLPLHLWGRPIIRWSGNHYCHPQDIDLNYKL